MGHLHERILIGGNEEAEKVTINFPHEFSLPGVAINLTRY